MIWLYFKKIWKIIFNFPKFQQKSKENIKQLPIILGWNEFFNSGNVIKMVAPYEQISKCNQKCIYSDNRKE